MNPAPDPARYVDAFEELANKWKDWHDQWEEVKKDLNIQDYATRQRDFLTREEVVRLMVEITRKGNELFEAQAQVNAMMLAALDNLKQTLNPESQP